MARRASKETEKAKTNIDFTLRRVFHKQAFRPLQREVIRAVIDGHDVFLQAATSFGKSLCFQLPAAISTGITVVVSPLLALMTNQIEAARELGIPTESISSTTTFTERKAIEKDLQCGHPTTRLLYVTPELCATDNFRRLLLKIHQQGQLTRVAIDEAHCISEWGHDFRPAYKQLSWLKQTLILPSVPIIALTATATPRVREDIVKSLQFSRLISPTQANPSTVEKQTLFFGTTSARPNIHYEVRYFSESSPRDPSGDDLFPYLLSWLKTLSRRRAHLLASLPHPSPSSLAPITGIIYVPTRVLADVVAQKLQSHSVTATAYHAGLDAQARISIQANFINPPVSPINDAATLSGSFNIITATTAFGMGIDCSTVRFVIHYGMPRGLESFIQESGRAGRDGKAAASIVLYTRESRDRAMYRLAQDTQKEVSKRRHDPQPNSAEAQAQAKLSSLTSAITFCEATYRCRHQLISEYFGDEPNGTAVSCDYACDFCKEGQHTLRKRMETGLASEEAAGEFTQRERMEVSQGEVGDPYDYWSQV